MTSPDASAPTSPSSSTVGTTRSTAIADAARVSRDAAPVSPALPARLEPWMHQLVQDPARCAALLAEHGSPVNVVHTAAFARNGRELIEAGRSAGLTVRPFFARKANKALAFVDAAREAHFGVDVASLAELAQVLDRGVDGADVVVSAAMKDERLIDLALRAGAVISLDNRTETAQVLAAAEALGVPARVCPRLAVDPALVAPTRFGERLAVWRELAPELASRARVEGVHVHLHGYAAADRAAALNEVLVLIDALRAAGAQPFFVDLGGGVPMSYLDEAAPWEEFWRVHRAQLEAGTPLTWRGRTLENVYPYFQNPVRGPWLTSLLSARLHDGTVVADALRARNLELRLEPGRSLLDGCGMTLARVMFTKERADGVPLMGVAMNRTQMRTTSDEFLVDPLLVRTGEPHLATGERQPSTDEPFEGFVVGAYCIEDELIYSRRLRFVDGAAPGDVLAMPNTAGYFMHIVESASHQLPLAVNVVADRDFAVDLIDRGRPDPSLAARG